jgi:hypothetical protein
MACPLRVANPPLKHQLFPSRTTEIGHAMTVSREYAISFGAAMLVRREK